MARVKVEKQSTLDEMITNYGEQNTQCNALKKVVADLNAKIKQAIHDEQKENTDIVVNGWKCSLTVTEDKVMNEDKLLEFAKEHKLKVIRTKEYVDTDALEKLMYAGKLTPALIVEMDKCNEIKIKETLRCTKVKGE